MFLATHKIRQHSAALPARARPRKSLTSVVDFAGLRWVGKSSRIGGSTSAHRARVRLRDVSIDHALSHVGIVHPHVLFPTRQSICVNWLGDAKMLYWVPGASTSSMASPPAPNSPEVPLYTDATIDVWPSACSYSTGNPGRIRMNRLLRVEWDAIAGIVAALVALIMHFLHILEINTSV